MKGKHLIKFGVKGAPDIVAVHRGRYVGIEVKKPGELATAEQNAFGSALIAAGGEYLVAYRVEDVMSLFA